MTHRLRADTTRSLAAWVLVLTPFTAVADPPNTVYVAEAGSAARTPGPSAATPAQVPGTDLKAKPAITLNPNAAQALMRPDLTVDVVAANPNKNWQIFIRNTGKQSAGPFQMKLSCEQACEVGKLKGNCSMPAGQSMIPVAGLAPGATDTRQIPKTALPQPMYYCEVKLIAEVDPPGPGHPAGQVFETNDKEQQGLGDVVQRHTAVVV